MTTRTEARKQQAASALALLADCPHLQADQQPDEVVDEHSYTSTHPNTPGAKLLFADVQRHVFD